MTNNFEENRSKLNSILSWIKNRKLLTDLFNKNTTIEEQIDQAEKISNIEKELNSIDNIKLKWFISNKVSSTKLDDVFDIINDSKKVYNEFDRHKNRVTQWKVILEYIKMWKTLTNGMKWNIKDILENTPKDISQEMWLDLSVLKTSLSAYLRYKRDDFSKDQLKLSNEEKVIKKEIENNVNVLSNEIKILRERSDELSNILPTLIDENQKNIKQEELNNLNNVLNEKTSELKTKRDGLLIRIKQLNETKVENFEQVKELKKIEDFLIETKHTELKNSWLENISSDIVSIYLDNYNEQLPKLEKIYREQIEEEDKIFFDNIKEQIENNQIDPEVVKKKLEDEANQRSTAKREKDIEFDDGYEKINEKIVTNDIAENDDLETKARKIIESKWSILKTWVEKLDYIIQNKDNNQIQDIWINKQVTHAISNIQKKVSELKKEYTEYMKSWDYDEKKAQDYDFKIKSYNDLTTKLQDKNISDIDKKWLLALLWKWKWLWEYINHRSNNYWYTIEYVWKELTKLRNQWYQEWKFVELYEKWLDEQKFNLIEKFAKLKSSIPNFDSVSLNDDIYKQAQDLWISDDESLVKIEELKMLQDNIKNLDLSLYTKSFIDNSLEYLRLQKESDIKSLIEEKDQQLKMIDRLPISQVEKDAQKSEYLEVYEKKLATLENERDKIKNEVLLINEKFKDNWFFSKSELKDISNNMNLFGIVWNIDEYSDIIAWLSDDIVNWNTDFINFENYRNIDSDFYTTSKLNELVWSHIVWLEENIRLIWDKPELRWIKNSLIKERAEYESIERKLNNGELLDESVLDILSNESLFKLELQKRNQDILKKMSNPNILPDELSVLQSELRQNLDTIKLINNKENLTPELQEEIITIGEKFWLDREIIKKELSDWFNNANTINDWLFSRYKWYSKKVFEDAQSRVWWFSDIWKAAKVIKKEFFWNDDYLNESSEKRKDRHERLDKYFDAAFSTWFAYLIIMFFKFFKTATHNISRIGPIISDIRKFIEANRTTMFFSIAWAIFFIIWMSSKNELTFMQLNTNLYSINTYMSENWNIKFSDFLWWNLEKFYYSINAYIFFIFLITLYQIIIEFVYKYIKVLKNPTIWIDNFLTSILKLLVFFLFMWILFKVNTLIL